MTHGKDITSIYLGLDATRLGSDSWEHQDSLTHFLPYEPSSFYLCPISQFKAFPPVRMPFPILRTPFVVLSEIISFLEPNQINARVSSHFYNIDGNVSGDFKFDGKLGPMKQLWIRSNGHWLTLNNLINFDVLFIRINGSPDSPSPI
ncbi:hypothetical protein L3Y34_005507 [Caenorhabditis briggsae]|uniref:F-box domain-containing protein n=1 Tax=Caenorhabditis briggsae TaxID=6238 RepID=A0AAE9D6D8_CAEBR|nr:hypothetical protein L3Y34_005507 [Caenorhabditis briggsae]